MSDDINPAVILEQIKNNEWKWMKVKRFKPEDFPDVADRLSALEKHHGRSITLRKRSFWLTWFVVFVSMVSTSISMEVKNFTSG